jgi:ABC-type proline/glycine betaine transport system permease subunit
MKVERNIKPVKRLLQILWAIPVLAVFILAFPLVYLGFSLMATWILADAFASATVGKVEDSRSRK